MKRIIKTINILTASLGLWLCPGICKSVRALEISGIETIDEALELEEGLLEQDLEENVPIIMEEIPDGFLKIDFEEQKEINPDIYAWIDIPGTVVSYPVLQSANDMEEDYYLEHNLDHSAGYPGCIFTERDNQKDFTDILTVVYGHNMRDESMFGSLRHYTSEEYMEEHSEIDIYTREGLYQYEVMAGVVYDKRHLIYSYGLYNLEKIQEFLDSYYSYDEYPDECVYRIGWENARVEEDTYLVLSTCVGGGRGDNRFLLLARLKSAPWNVYLRIEHRKKVLKILDQMSHFVPVVSETVFELAEHISVLTV